MLRQKARRMHAKFKKNVPGSISVEHLSINDVSVIMVKLDEDLKTKHIELKTEHIVLNKRVKKGILSRPNCSHWC